MQEMIDGDNDKRTVWAKVLQSRGEMGYPYIFFTDNANNNAADVYKDKKLPIYASNLCTKLCCHQITMVFCLCFCQHQCIALR